MQEVWLVSVIYQYDGYDGSEVYGTKEKACEAANQLVFEFEEEGYIQLDLYDDDKFSADRIGDWCYTILGSLSGEVEIKIEKKLVR